MQLEIKNIGPFQDATLHVGDVTVIAGVNDTGKSYVSRLLFAMVKIVTSDIETQVVKNFLQFMENIFKQLETSLLDFSAINFSDKEKATPLFEALTKTMHKIEQDNKLFLQEWVTKFAAKKQVFNIFWINLLKHCQELLLHHDELLAKILLQIDVDTNKDAYKIKTVKYTLTFINKDIMEMLDFFVNEKKDIAAFLIQNILNDNFHGETLQNKNYLTSESSLKLNLTNDKVFHIKLNNHNKITVVNEFNYFANIIDNSILDVTYISDTQAILDVMLEQNYKQQKSSYVLENEALALAINNIFKFNNCNYWVDFTNKLNDINHKEQYSNLKTVLVKEKISKKLASYFLDNNKINFENASLTKNGVAVKLVNSSRGLKIIEAFKLMVNNNFFKANTLIIIDEPEAYIHPEWQYLFIRTLLDIANIAKFKLVISTHSPYIIETITSVAARDFKKLDFTYNFINKDKNSNSCIIKKDSLDHINEALSYPYRELDKYEFDWEFKK